MCQQRRDIFCLDGGGPCGGGSCGDSLCGSRPSGVDRGPNFRDLIFFSRGGRRNFTRCSENSKVVHFRFIFESESAHTPPHIHQRHPSTSRPDSRISSHLPGVLWQLAVRTACCPWQNDVGNRWVMLISSLPSARWCGLHLPRPLRSKRMVIHRTHERTGWCVVLQPCWANLATWRCARSSRTHEYRWRTPLLRYRPDLQVPVARDVLLLWGSDKGASSSDAAHPARTDSDRRPSLVEFPVGD